jgi:hypothetical protein
MNQLSSTVSLLCILFEDLGCVIELHDKFADKVTERHSLGRRKYLFNGQEGGDDCNYFLFGQGIIKEAKSADKEYLKLYESWCLLAYREFYKNLLAILDEVSLRTYGEKSNIPNRLCKHFGLHDDERIHAYLMNLSNNNNSDPGFSYGTVMNNQRYIIHSGITRAHQFSLGNIPTMSSITESMGKGWGTRKISKYFNVKTTLQINKKKFP